MKLEPALIPLNKIVRLPRNPKEHDLGAIHQSIGRFGFLARIIVNRTTDRLLHGEGRVDTLQQMKAMGQGPPPGIEIEDGGWSVPGDYVELPESEEEAAATALNQLTILGGWDDAALAAVLADLAAQDLLEGTGFDGDDADEVLRRIAVPDFQPVAISTQPRLDEKAKVMCPECGCEFTP